MSDPVIGLDNVVGNVSYVIVVMKFCRNRPNYRKVNQIVEQPESMLSLVIAYVCPDADWLQGQNTYQICSVCALKMLLLHTLCFKMPSSQKIQFPDETAPFSWRGLTPSPILNDKMHGSATDWHRSSFQSMIRWERLQWYSGNMPDCGERDDDRITPWV